MALKSCRECKKKVSTEAETCPKCGVPNPTLVMKKTKRKRAYGRTGLGGWPVEYLEAQAELHSSDDQKKSYKSPEEWDEVYANFKKEIGDKKIVDKELKTNTSGKYFFNGIYSLGVTFWGYLVGGNFIFKLIIYFYMSAGSSLDVVLIFVVLNMMWNILAIIGVFNSADNYKIKKISQGQSYTWATVAKVTCVL